MSHDVSGHWTAYAQEWIAWTRAHGWWDRMPMFCWLTAQHRVS